MKKNITQFLNKNIALSIFFTFLFLSAFSQAKFEKFYGDKNTDNIGQSIKITKSGYVIILGSTVNFGSGGFDFYLLKLNKNGDTIWTKTFGGVKNEIGNALLIDKDGDFIMVGTTESINNKMKDIYVVKTDSNGIVRWTKNFGSNLDDYGFDVIQNKMGGYTIAGSQVLSDTVQKGYVIAMNLLGEKVWDFIIHKDNNFSEEKATSIVQESNGNYNIAIAGYFPAFAQIGEVGGDYIFTSYDNRTYIENSKIIQANNGDLFILYTDYDINFVLVVCNLLKLSFNGDSVFTKSYSIDNLNYNYANSIVKAPNGNYFILSYVDYGDSTATYVLEINENGDELNRINFNKTQNLKSGIGHSIIIKNADLFISGTSTNNIGNKSLLFLKSDTSGNGMNHRSFGVEAPSAEEYGYSAQQTSDRGFILLGTKFFLGKNNDFYLVKTDENGIEQWAKNYGTENEETPWSVQQTTDRGYILFGYSHIPKTGSFNIYLAKINELGMQEWSKSYISNSISILGNVIELATGEFVIASSSKVLGNGYDGFLLKINSKGDSLWSKTYGGPLNERFYHISQCTDGGFVMSGQIAISNKENDGFIVKTDKNGVTLWSKNYGSVGSDRLVSIQQTKDLGFVAFGYYDFYNGFLLKLNANGDSVWSKIISTEGFEYYGSYVVKQTKDLGYLLICNKSAWGTDKIVGQFIKTDSTGNTLWVKSYGDNFPRFYSGGIANDNGYYAFGFQLNYLNNSNDYYLIKTDSTGDAKTGFGILKKENQLLSIFPNPNNGEFSFKFNQMNNENYVLSIYDALGKQFYIDNKFKNNYSSENHLNLKGMPSGLYFIKLMNDKNQFINSFIKK